MATAQVVPSFRPSSIGVPNLNYPRRQGSAASVGEIAVDRSTGREQLHKLMWLLRRLLLDHVTSAASVIDKSRLLVSCAVNHGKGCIVLLLVCPTAYVLV